MTDISEESLDALQAKMAMSAEILGQHANVERCPTFSRGDCREWAERFGCADAAITALRAENERLCSLFDDMGYFPTGMASANELARRYVSADLAAYTITDLRAENEQLTNQLSKAEAAAREQMAGSHFGKAFTLGALEARDARVRAGLIAEIERLRDGLEAIHQYGSDTLLGPSQGIQDDRKWQRQGCLEMTERASRVLAGESWKASEPDTPHTDESHEAPQLDKGE